MNKRLRIYFDDHLAAMSAELELIERCRKNNQDNPLAPFLAELHEGVSAQKSGLEQLVLRLGEKKTVESRLKESAGWAAEKLGRLKLNDSLLSYSPLSRLLELEMLIATATGRLSLWESLEAIMGNSSQVEPNELTLFRRQTKQHLEDLKSRHRFVATEALGETAAV